MSEPPKSDDKSDDKSNLEKSRVDTATTVRPEPTPTADNDVLDAQTMEGWKRAAEAYMNGERENLRKSTGLPPYFLKPFKIPVPQNKPVALAPVEYSTGPSEDYFEPGAHARHTVEDIQLTENYMDELERESWERSAKVNPREFKKVSNLHQLADIPLHPQVTPVTPPTKSDVLFAVSTGEPAVDALVEAIALIAACHFKFAFASKSTGGISEMDYTANVRTKYLKKSVEILKLVRKGTTFRTVLAYDNYGGIIGVATATTYEGKSTDIHIADSCVREDFRKIGVGRELLDRLLQDSNAKHMTLMCPAENQNALGFFIRNGFKVILRGYPEVMLMAPSADFATTKQPTKLWCTDAEFSALCYKLSIPVIADADGSLSTLHPRGLETQEEEKRWIGEKTLPHILDCSVGIISDLAEIGVGYVTLDGRDTFLRRGQSKTSLIFARANAVAKINPEISKPVDIYYPGTPVPPPNPEGKFTESIRRAVLDVVKASLELWELCHLWMAIFSHEKEKHKTGKFDLVRWHRLAEIGKLQIEEKTKDVNVLRGCLDGLFKNWSMKVDETKMFYEMANGFFIPDDWKTVKKAVGFEKEAGFFSAKLDEMPERTKNVMEEEEEEK